MPAQVMMRPREATGTGRFAPKASESQPLPDQAPPWVARRDQESDEQWASRIWGQFFEYQLNQGFTHDLVALKRHELAAKHLWPAKQQIELTRGEDWLRHATDEELMQLKAIRDRASARQSPIPIPQDVVIEGDNGSGNSQAVCNHAIPQDSQAE